MKNSKIFLAGILALLSLSACSEFLDVKSDSKYDEEYVFGNMEEINRALNACYTYMLDGNTYGGAYYSTFCLNSDVEYATSTSDMQSSAGTDYKQFDATSAGSHLEKTWQSAYRNIEYCNNFITAAEVSPMMAENEEALMQMIGESSLAGTRTAGDANEKRAHGKPPELFFLIINVRLHKNKSA